MVTMKVYEQVNLASHILRKRLSSGDEKLTLTEALWQFIQQADPELARQAEEATQARFRLNELIDEDGE